MVILGSLLLPATAACFFYSAQLSKGEAYSSPTSHETISLFNEEDYAPNFETLSEDRLLSDKEKFKAIGNFAYAMAANTFDIEPEIVTFVNNNFWDLI